jgi:hypothetical protein
MGPMPPVHLFIPPLMRKSDVKKNHYGQVWWLMLIISASQETDSGKVKIQGRSDKKLVRFCLSKEAGRGGVCL